MVGLLVILGDDLGTTFLLLVILLALLWVIGTPARLFVGILGLVLFALVLLIKVAQYRSGRITGFLNPTLSNNWQLVQGKYAIGSGGFFGVGLGDSQLKWGWVPNDDTDFIFAILGEELGLIGTGCVVLLYGGLAFAGIRVARRVTDPFMRLAAAGATAWIVVQALVNISAVIGLLPITGVPLPLISQGLSSVLATMTAIGMLLCFARSEPGARQALAVATPRWRRKLGAAFGRSGANSGPVATPATGGRRPRSPGHAGPQSTPTRSAGRPERSRLTNPETSAAKVGSGRRTRGDDRVPRVLRQGPAGHGPAQQHPPRQDSGPKRPRAAHPGQRPGPPPRGPLPS